MGRRRPRRVDLYRSEAPPRVLLRASSTPEGLGVRRSEPDARFQIPGGHRVVSQVEGVPTDVAVHYLRELSTTWRRGDGGPGWRISATSWVRRHSEASASLAGRMWIRTGSGPDRSSGQAPQDLRADLVAARVVILDQVKSDRRSRRDMTRRPRRHERGNHPQDDVRLLALPEAISRDDRREGSLIDVRIDQIAGEQAQPHLGRSRHTGQHECPVLAKVAKH